MRPHIMRGLIWDPNCLKLRLYISKMFEWKQRIFAVFEDERILIMQGVKPNMTRI